MPYLTKNELLTHLNLEVIDAISREDDAKVTTAINAAIEEARGYIGVYDTNTVFNATGDDRNPILLMYVKDIAVWHFINVANPAVEYQAKLDRYEKAISWLQKVQSGKTNPILPTTPEQTDGVYNESRMKWGSNPKRPTNY